MRTVTGAPVGADDEVREDQRDVGQMGTAGAGHQVKAGTGGADVGDDVFDPGGVRLDALLNRANEAIGLTNVRALRGAYADECPFRIALGEKLGPFTDLGIEHRHARQQTDG